MIIRELIQGLILFYLGLYAHFPVIYIDSTFHANFILISTMIFLHTSIHTSSLTVYSLSSLPSILLFVVTLILTRTFILTLKLIKTYNKGWICGLTLPELVLAFPIQGTSHQHCVEVQAHC